MPPALLQKSIQQTSELPVPECRNIGRDIYSAIVKEHSRQARYAEQSARYQHFEFIEYCPRA